ncbi:MAG: hypothetical protein NTU83_00440 [Candidatus Hydrogenedentes bacterium]|nr:hypothetical protein [Candidatus Hydrogenedentota bacterium]
MERDASPRIKLEWRFQQGLYRAYYDAYIYRRLAYETELEREATDELRRAGSVGAALALDQAERIINRAVLEPVAQDLRARVFELGEALYQSIRMQLSVPKYQAIAADRGANLDLIDLPLNNRTWLLEQFGRIRALPNEPDRLRAIEGVADWGNPGPGGFYDDLGSLTQQLHLVKNTGAGTYAAQSPDYPDPEFRSEPLMAFDYDPRYRASWNYYAETRYESPLTLHYENLDPAASYKVRAIYAGDSMERRIRLTANGVEIHPFIGKPTPPKPLEFDIPREVTAKGNLTLSWSQEPGRGGNGRGCQVAEVWLIRKTER